MLVRYLREWRYNSSHQLFILTSAWSSLLLWFKRSRFARSGCPRERSLVRNMLPLHRLFCLLALTVLAGTSVVAQKPASRLIVDKVDESQLMILKGNTPPAAMAKNDLGRVDSGMRMSDLILVLQRSPEMQAAFDAFVESQYEPGSPNYHQWLTPEQIGERFGPALADIATVSAWLTGHGLSVDGVSKDRMTIRFSGSARQVEVAFHTELHSLTVKGVPHFSNMTDPQIPMALEPVVLGPKAMSNFIPRPLHRLGGKVTQNRETGQWRRAGQPAAATTGVRPEIGFSCGTNCQVEDLTPYDFAAIYNLTPLWTAGIDGTNQTVAIAGRSDVRATDVATFRSAFGLSGGGFNTIHNGTDPGYCTAASYTSTVFCTLDDQIENALDVEWSGATAPKATIDLVVTQQTNTNDAIYESANYVIQNNTAKIINVSYGNCELFLGTSGNAAYNTLWQSAASAGIAVFVATGDSGAPACDQGGDASGTPYVAQYGLAVSGIASTPYDTAVGGTDFNWGSTASPYWNATNSSSNGSSAKGYIPEFPWNNTCTTPLALTYVQGIAKQLGLTAPTDADSACNFVAAYYAPIYQQYQVDISWLLDTVGGGGGASNCTTNSTTSTTADPTSCSGGYAKPAWQAGVSGIPTDGKRDVPDVSFFAGSGLLGSAYLICVSDWATSAGTTCVTNPYPATEPVVGEIGGTSAASPAMAGVMALINQKAGSPQGNPNSQLYTLGGKQIWASCSSATVTNSSSCYFNDVNTGTVSMACATGSQNCTTESSGDLVGVLSGFAAGVGFDNATGLGTLNVANVVNGWTAMTIGTASSTVTVTPTPSSIKSNQGVSVAVTVAGSGGNPTPTGSVTLTGGGYTSSSQTLSSGSTTFVIPANSLTEGTDTLTASYSGDPTYALNTGTTQVTVTAAPKPTVTVTPASSAINSGQSLGVTGTVIGSSGTATGTVTISGGGYTSPSQALDGSGGYSFTIPTHSLSAGTDTLTVNYSGDSTYGMASGTANVTVTQSTFALAATTPSAISRGSSATSTITWTTTNNYAANVTLSTCTLNAGSPSNTSADTPRCTLTSAAFGTAGSGTATVTTSAATKSALQKPQIGGWGEAGSGALLAVLVFLGIPARRRGWRAMAGMLGLLFVLGGFAACGGGGSGGGGGTSDPGTTSGAYIFTVKATGGDPAATTSTTTFTVTVN